MEAQLHAFSTSAKKPVTGPYLSQMNPVKTLAFYISKIHFNIILTSTPVFRVRLPFRFSD
jgi:hypothetical protein